MVTKRISDSGLNPEPNPNRATFDAVLKQLCNSPPLPRKKVKVGKKKLGRILGKK
ncbi:MAG: hypothetical protein WB952_04045 [Terriglobales bacterium]